MTIQNTIPAVNQVDYWNAVCLPLSQGKHAVIDSDDFEYLTRWEWHFNAKGYAGRYVTEGGHRRLMMMHQAVLKYPDEIEADHRDWDGLNNRKANLRVCTHSQNSMNKKPMANVSSQYKGVSWCKSRGMWQVRIKVNGSQKWLGYFASETMAAEAYNRAAEELFGDFAYLNPVDPISLENAKRYLAVAL